MIQYIKTRSTLMKSILLIAAPAVVEMALNTMLNIADTAMIGRMVGEEALSAIGMVNSIFFLLIFVFSSFNTGAIALISRAYGEKEIEKADEIAGNNLSLNLVIGLVITILAFLTMDVLMAPYDITETVRHNAESYFGIIVVGLIFQFGSFAFAAISRGVTDTKTPMYITGFVNIFNIVFNYLLIKGVWIFPELGIRGAAISTTMARAIAFLIYLYIFTSGKHRVKINLPMLKFKKHVTNSLWKISLPGALEQFFMQGAFLLLGMIITILDTSSEALFRILISIEQTSFMPAVGISIATATLVGKSIGEKDIEKAADSGYLATIMGVAWGFIAGILFFIFPDVLLSIFTKEAALIELGRPVFTVMAINQIFLNAYIVMSGALRGAGDTRAVMVITTMRLWTIFIPLSYFLINSFGYGVSAVWYAEILSFIVYLIFIFRRFQKRKWASITI